MNDTIATWEKQLVFDNSWHVIDGN